MNKDGLKEELSYLLLAKNNMWTIFIAVSGGSLGLLFVQSHNILKWILIPTGFVFAFFFLDAYFRKDDKIESIIKKLKEGN